MGRSRTGMDEQQRDRGKDGWAAGGQWGRKGSRETEGVIYGQQRDRGSDGGATEGWETEGQQKDREKDGWAAVREWGWRGSSGTAEKQAGREGSRVEQLQLLKNHLS